jgi:hypothetical protein
VSRNSFTAGGDLSGTISSQTVIKINGNSVATQTLGASSDGYVLTWQNTDGYWKAKPAAAGGTPGGSDTYVQFNDSSTLGGDAGLTYNKTTNVLSISDALAVGANPADAGAIRLANATKITFRNSTNAANYCLANLTSGNSLYLGINSSLGEQVPNILAYAGTAMYLGVGTADKLTMTSALTTSGNDLAIGTTVASAGALRLSNTGIVKARNAANSGDVHLIGCDSSNDVYVGVANDASSNIARIIGLYASSSVYLGISGTTHARVSSDGLTVYSNSGSLLMGNSGTASAGKIRMRNTDAINVRNAGGTADILAVDVDATDYVNVGNTNAAGIKSGTAFGLKRGTSNSSTGTLNDVSTANMSFLKFTNATGPTITGFGNGYDGKMLVCYFTAASTVADENASSTAANRIVTASGNDVAVAAGTTLMFIYDGDSSRWRPIGVEV